MDSQFKCSSPPVCIPMSHRCNGQIDCADKSDERNCREYPSDVIFPSFGLGDAVFALYRFFEFSVVPPVFLRSHLSLAFQVSRYAIFPSEFQSAFFSSTTTGGGTCIDILSYYQEVHMHTNTNNHPHTCMQTIIAMLYND